MWHDSSVRSKHGEARAAGRSDGGWKRAVIFGLALADLCDLRARPVAAQPDDAVARPHAAAGSPRDAVPPPAAVAVPPPAAIAAPPRPAVAAAPDAADEPAAELWLELRAHLGDSEQDEVVHPGLFPSLVLGAAARVAPRWHVEVALSYAKVTAQWENIGGPGVAYLGARHRRGAAILAAGATAPLGADLPAPACFSTPPQTGGDSQTYRFNDDPACWDRSAYRRAALHRGMWNAWLWAPDWYTAAATAELAELPGLPFVGLAGGVGLALPATDHHDGVAVPLQLALTARHHRRSLTASGRLLAAGALAGDRSPFILSAEAGLQLRRGALTGALTFTLPFADLRNDPVPPGQGGYRIVELWSLGTSLTAAFD